MTINWMPRRLVTPAAAASSNARRAPAVAIDSTDSSGIDCLHNPAELLPEINQYHVAVSADIAAPFRVQDQVPPRVDVLVVLKTVLSKHPHELCAAGSDSKFQRIPVRRLKLHCRGPAFRCQCDLPDPAA